MARNRPIDIVFYDLPRAFLAAVIGFVLFRALAERVKGAEFDVESKVSAATFTVESKVPKAPAIPTDPNVPAPAGYRWIKRGDGPWKLEKAAPEVAAPKSFPAVRDGHQCPACGRSQYVVDGFNTNGTHRHRCPVDGAVWSH